jgi:hypothetical protein
MQACSRSFTVTTSTTYVPSLGRRTTGAEINLNLLR